MHMGNIKGWRYSTLKQITPANVWTLKQAWHIHLGTCPTKDSSAARNEGNAVVCERRLLHLHAEERRLRARRGDRGMLWRYTPTFDPGFPKASVQRQPGVAIGDGKVYIGQVDGYLSRSTSGRARSIWKTRGDPVEEGRPSRVRAALLQRHGDRGHERRRPGQHQQRHGGVRRDQRPPAVGVEHRARAGPAGQQHLDGGRHPLRRRRDVGDTRDRPEAQPGHLRHRQPGAVELARSGRESLRATRSSRSTSTRASSSGPTRPSTTTSGTPTCRTRRCCRDGK